MTLQPSPEFDEYSADYDAALAHGLSVSGENKTYFARGRIAWLGRCLEDLQEKPQHVMDFGCGTGSAVPFMLDLLQSSSVVGVDVSMKSLEIARRTCDSDRARFLSFDQFEPKGQIDLAFCNGVFHHIPIATRRQTQLHLSVLATGRSVGFLGKQPLESGHALRDEPHSI